MTFELVTMLLIGRVFHFRGLRTIASAKEKKHEEAECWQFREKRVKGKESLYIRGQLDKEEKEAGVREHGC